MIKKIIDFIVGPEKEIKYIITCNDENRDKQISLLELISNLEARIEYLEKENVSLTNELYEVENRLQSQLDKINPHTYNLQKLEKTNEL